MENIGGNLSSPSSQISPLLPGWWLEAHEDEIHNSPLVSVFINVKWATNASNMAPYRDHQPWSFLATSFFFLQNPILAAQHSPDHHRSKCSSFNFCFISFLTDSPALSAAPKLRVIILLEKLFCKCFETGHGPWPGVCLELNSNLLVY